MIIPLHSKCLYDIGISSRPIRNVIYWSLIFACHGADTRRSLDTAASQTPVKVSLRVKPLCIENYMVVAASAISIIVNVLGVVRPVKSASTVFVMRHLALILLSAKNKILILRKQFNL